MKHSKDIIRNRTRKLPACTAVPQPTAPAHVLLLYVNFHVVHAVYSCYIYITGTIYVLAIEYFTLNENYDASNSNAYSCISSNYTECHRRKGPNFGRVFLMLNYTDITQNTYIQS